MELSEREWIVGNVWRVRIVGSHDREDLVGCAATWDWSAALAVSPKSTKGADSRTHGLTRWTDDDPTRPPSAGQGAEEKKKGKTCEVGKQKLRKEPVGDKDTGT